MNEFVSIQFLKTVGIREAVTKATLMYLRHVL